MYEYHGWLRTNERVNILELEAKLREINNDYPFSAKYVNGGLHVSFSGCSNRNLGFLKKVVTYITSLSLKFTGIVYINDSSSERFNHFDVIKVVNDEVVRMGDKNFSESETKEIFE